MSKGGRRDDSIRKVSKACSMDKNSANGSELDKDLVAQQEVLRYWFLLDREHARAIAKGNIKLLDTAWPRIYYLQRQLEPKLLQQGLEGDEEALCMIHWQLMNKGWWEKARNLDLRSEGYIFDKDKDKRSQDEEDDLVGFILSKSYMIHPNVINMVKRRDQEGIRMALNHIHYNSLQTSREIKSDRVNATTTKKLNKEKVTSNTESEFNFIKSNGALVDAWILKEALKGEDFFVNRALFQIHSRSLESAKFNSGSQTNHQNITNKSFKDILLSSPPSKQPKVTITNKASSRNNIYEKNLVFVSNIPTEAQAKDIWAFFKKMGKILDVFIPKRGDRYGKRYGFVKLPNHMEASIFMQRLGGARMGSNKLKVDYALKKKSVTSPPTSVKVKSQERKDNRRINSFNSSSMK